MLFTSVSYQFRCYTWLDRVSGFPIGVGNDCCYEVGNDCSYVVGNDGCYGDDCRYLVRGRW